MKTATVILPFLCAFAAAAPTCGGLQACGNTAVRRQNVNDGGSSILGGLGSLKARQNSAIQSTSGGLLSGLGLRARQDFGDDDGKDDDSLANGVDGSRLKTDSNGQNVDAADLGSALGSLRRLLRRAIGPVQSVPVENADSNGDDDESVANVLDGSAAGVNQNAQNVSVAELRRRQLLGSGLGGLLGGGSVGGQTENEDNGNRDDDESVLNLLDGDTTDVDRNAQNLTIARRQATEPYEDNKGDGDRDNNESVANVLDDSAAAVDQNAQNVDVLRRQVIPSPVASPSVSVPATAAATPSATPTPSPSSAPIAPVPAADPAPEPSRPVVDAGDGVSNARDNDNDDDDALLNAADNDGAEVDRNLDGVTVLKKRQDAIPGEIHGLAGADENQAGDVVYGSAQAANNDVQGVDDAAESQ